MTIIYTKLGLGIYSKPMQPIQKSVSEPIQVIPDKPEASFNPHESEAHLKSILTLNPNASDQSESVQTFNPNESEEYSGDESNCESSEILMLLPSELAER